jgi:hypothetical protein
MAKRSFDWREIQIFQVDERCVPPDNALGNFRMMRESLPDAARIEEAAAVFVEKQKSAPHRITLLRAVFWKAPGIRFALPPVGKKRRRSAGFSGGRSIPSKLGLRSCRRTRRGSERFRLRQIPVTKDCGYGRFRFSG